MTPGVQVGVLSAEARVGLRAQFVLDGECVSATYQRIRGSSMIGEPAVLGFTAVDLAGEILRCVPPARPGADVEDLDEMALPWESALLLADPESRAAVEVHRLNRWRETPEPLASILGPMQAWCDVVTSCAGYAWVRHWVRGDRGWVELGLDEGMVRLIPLRREDMYRRLIADLASAVGSLRSAA